MGPARAGLVSAEFSCVEGRRYSEQSAIPAMSSWSRFALLLMVVGVASLVMRRRFS
jgi:hypothetical protein